MFPCDLCSEENQTVDAVALCTLCQKYLCNSCVKYHGKFLPDHTLSYGTDQDGLVQQAKCKIHVNEALELCCEKHTCVLCRFCKPLKHDHCSVQKISDIMKERNIKKEFDESLESLLELCKVMNKKRNETQKKIETYYKEKEHIKTRAKTLQKALNDIFLGFEKKMESQQEVDMENLEANVQSYGNFCQELERQLCSLKKVRRETSREALFIYVTDANRAYKKYKLMLEKIETIGSAISSFVLKDEKIPALLQELASISCMNSVPQSPGKVIAMDDPQPRLKLMIDQFCQTDSSLEDHLEILQQDQSHSPGNGQPVRSHKLKEDQMEITDDTECVSSEEMSALHVTGFFCNVKSFNFTQETKRCYYELNEIAFMPNDEIVVCRKDGIEILDMNMTRKLLLAPHDHASRPEHIAVVNQKSVVVSFPDRELLQLVTIIPKFEFGKKIKLDCQCAGLKCFKKQFYIYTNRLDQSSCITYPGFQVVSMDGKVLKRIPLLDYVRYFTIKKSGDIVYFGNRAGTEHRFLKCISTDGNVLTEYHIPYLPDAAISDDDGNLITCDLSSGKIATLKPDGTEGRILSSIDRRLGLKSVSLSYNKNNHTCLVAFDRRYDTKYGAKTENVIATYNVEFL